MQLGTESGSHAYSILLYECSWLQHRVLCTLGTQANSSRLLKGQCHEIFCFWFFHESVFPQPQSIPFGPFRIFQKIRGDIPKSRCTTSINDPLTQAAKLPPVSMTPAANFATSFASVVDTGGNLPPVSKTPAANLGTISGC